MRESILSMLIWDGFVMQLWLFELPKKSRNGNANKITLPCIALTLCLR